MLTSEQPLMKPWLKWSLIGSLGLSAWAVLFPAREAPKSLRGSAAFSDLPPTLHTSTSTPATSFNMTLKSASPLPTQLPQPQMDAAIADPFMGRKAVAPPQAPVIATAPPPPPVPVAPTLNYRFLGRVVDPDGQTQVYLSRAGKDLRVAKGTQLEEGYVVEAIKSDAVLLYYAALDYHTQIRISPPDTSP